jgi:hypothetical protein
MTKKPCFLILKIKELSFSISSVNINPNILCNVKSQAIVLSFLLTSFIYKFLNSGIYEKTWYNCLYQGTNNLFIS